MRKPIAFVAKRLNHAAVGSQPTFSPTNRPDLGKHSRELIRTRRTALCVGRDQDRPA